MVGGGFHSGDEFQTSCCNSQAPGDTCPAPLPELTRSPVQKSVTSVAEGPAPSPIPVATWLVTPTTNTVTCRSSTGASEASWGGHWSRVSRAVLEMACPCRGPSWRLVHPCQEPMGEFPAIHSMTFIHLTFEKMLFFLFTDVLAGSLG